MFSHSKPLFKNLEKMHPSALKPDPDLTLPHMLFVNNLQSLITCKNWSIF